VFTIILYLLAVVFLIISFLKDKKLDTIVYIQRLTFIAVEYILLEIGKF